MSYLYQIIVMFPILLICVLIPSCLSADLQWHSGMTISAPASTVESNYKTLFDDALKSLPTVLHGNKITISDFFGVSFEIKDLKAKSEIVSAISNLFIGENNVTFNTDENCVKTSIDFKYLFKIFGLLFFYGDGKAQYTVGKSQLTQFFNEDGISLELTKFKENLSITNIEGLDFFGGITYWSNQLLKENPIKEFKIGFVAEINKHIYDMYKKIAVLTPFLNNEDLNVHIFNQNVRFQKEGEFYYALFRPKVGVDNRPYNKTFYKFAKTSIAAGEALKVCITENVLIGISEVLAKARFFLDTIECSDIGLSDRLITLIPAMPKLAEVYDPNQKLRLGCRPLANTDILYLGVLQKDKPEDKFMQFPISCTFSGYPNGEDLVTLDIIMRAHANFTKGEDLSLNLIFKDPYLYYYSYGSAIVPVEDPTALQYIVQSIISHYHDKVMYPKPFQLNLSNTQKPKSLAYNGQYCYNY